ncbi:Mitochondrial-type heat shock protein 70 like [Verticillium longisporum]|uniref:Mitochondrial-type heat shock protein 70 like n=1 Tax=Verticillium longisporum TaxID=100787 RepID=A0A8I2ZBQ3_VERLO|nr:Mitochondrial-type heat shock protein 70 like [Verticillium longisporum]
MAASRSSTPGPPGLGVDCGTTTLCAYFGSQEVHVVHGEATYPTALRVLDGDFSLPRRDSHGPAVIELVKRLIGRRKNDPRLVEDAKNVPNAHVIDDDAVLMVENEKFRPEEITAYFLGRALRTAKDQHGRFASCVLTAPAYHSFEQRQALKDAAYMGGFNKDAVTVIDEPVAAIIDYIMAYPDDNIYDQVTVVIDIGGGTVDVAVIYPSKTSGHLTVLVKATSGNDRVGGMDVDRRMVDHVLATRKGAYVHDDDALLGECESGKRELSTARSVLSIPVRPCDVRADTEELVSITKTQFEGLCEPVDSAVRAALKDVTSLVDLHVKHVLMVGGSSSLPCVRRICKEWFPDARVLQSAGAVAVARGAAHVASDSSINFIQSLPRAIGVVAHSSDDAASSLRLDTVMRRNTQLPNQFERTFFTKLDNETEIEIELREGEALESSVHLGTLVIKDIPPYPKGTGILVTVKVPKLGTVIAKGTMAGLTKELTIVPIPRLSEEQLEEYRRRTSERLGDGPQKRGQIEGSGRLEDGEGSQKDQDGEQVSSQGSMAKRADTKRGALTPSRGGKKKKSK